MTDLHTHILPQLDDGAGSLEEADAILADSEGRGINSFALTPHFYPERATQEAFLKRRDESWARLSQLLAAKYPDVRVKLGAEVHYSPGLTQLDADALCLEGTKYLLLELSGTVRPAFFSQVLSCLDLRRIVPVIAHVERYPYAINNPGLLAEWIKAGCLIQVDAEAFFYDHAASKKLLGYIKSGLIHVIASDVHSVKERPQMLDKAYKHIEHRIGQEYVQELKANADDIFAGRYFNVRTPHLSFIDKLRH